MRTDKDTKDKARETEEFIYTIQPKKLRKKSGAGRITYALTSAIAEKKMPTLFDTINSPYLAVDGKSGVDLKGFIASDQAHYIDRRGKELYLTDKEMRITFALSFYLSLFKDEQEIKDYEEELSKGYRSSKIVKPVSVRELTRFVTGGEKVRKRDVDATFETIKKLSGIQQAQTFIYKDGDVVKSEVRFFAPLIQIDEGAEIKTPSEGYYDYILNIRFGGIFFFNFYRSYAPLSPKMFEVWGKKGSGTNTELFRILLNELLSKYTILIGKADKAAKAIQKEKSTYKTEKDYEQAVNTARTNALTYEEYATTLRDRITTDYESDRRYKGKFKKDLANAVEALKEIGIISDYYEDYPRGCEAMGMKMHFVLNKDYGKEADADILSKGISRRRKRLPKTDKEQDAEV